jgi:uncharacterized protein YhjY with autotransporter beta-barrel domain
VAEIVYPFFEQHRGAMAQAGPDGTETSDFLELQRRMTLIAFQKREIGIG